VDKLEPLLSLLGFLSTAWASQGPEIAAIRVLFLRVGLGLAAQLGEKDTFRVTASSPLFVPTTHSPGTSSIPYAHYLTSRVDAQPSATPDSTPTSRPSHKVSYSYPSFALLGPENPSNSFRLAAANEEKKILLGYRNEAKRVSEKMQAMKATLESWAAAEPALIPAIGHTDRARLFNSLEQQDGEARSTVNELMKAFMKPFSALFSDRASFDFFLSVFTQLLRCMQGPLSWRVVCLSALGSFLQANPKHQATEAQSTNLGEVLGLLYEAPFEKQVENVAQLLIDFNPNFRQGFSWVRSKPKLDPSKIERKEPR